MLILMALGALAPARAQKALFIEHDGKPALVVAVRAGRAYVREAGKLVRATSPRAGLVDVREFQPFFISVRHERARTSYVNLTLNGGSGDVNNQFEFHASFESPYDLENTFLVLILKTARGDRIFYYEVGHLQARTIKAFDVVVPLAEKLGEGRYELHLFSNGGEVLHSGMSPLFRDRALDRMVLRRVQGVAAAPLRPFVGPAPEYPPAFYQRKIRGEAVVKFRVTRTGAVLDPAVLSATAPEFGEAALAAIRLWRFLPAVKDGQPVEGVAQMPFQFAPPEEK